MDDYCAARSRLIPPLPWTTFSPPFSVTKGGRGQLRCVLYMATVSAIRANDNPLKARYQALVARGKTKKLAIAAVMRNMIVTLNAMVRDNKPWNSQHAA